MNLNRFRRLSLTFAFAGTFILNAPAFADTNIFSSLKSFFQTQLKPLSQQKIDLSSLALNPNFNLAQNAQWNERIQKRRWWNDYFRLNPDVVTQHLNDGLTNISGDPGLDPTSPDVAYDPTNNRYLFVWEEETAPGVFNIMARFYDRNGVAQGPAAVQISSARTTQGCFYANFDTDNGAITTPGLDRCQHAKNPTVAYNNGRYLIAWELPGRADFAHNFDGSDYDAGKNFSGIIAKIVNASDLSPVTPDFNEGILISKVWIAGIATASNAPATTDAQIQ
ncbi:MAG: hypothetical protein JNK65_01810, partial [Deltaproteobacteria bacterium]|nr:hypothetical protein [Deltaproteobacteria bacterium]